MHVLKKHLTIPDGGQWYGPSHFATANDDGSPRDQHWSFGRDVAASYIAPSAKYLRYGYRHVDPWYQPFGVQSPETMREQIQLWINNNNDFEGTQGNAFWLWGQEDTQRLPYAWGPSHHLGVPNLAWEYYPGAGFYAEVSAGSDTLPGEHITQHVEDFVTWKLSGMGGIIHTGGLSWYPDRSNGGLCGLSGGGVSAIYTDKGGIGILGRTRGSQGPQPDTWDNIDSWAVNHVWGEVGGVMCSTARERDGLGDVIDDSDDLMIRTTYDMVDRDGNIISGVKRVFDISREGAQVLIEVENITGLTKLYETLPPWLGDGYATEDSGETTLIQAKVNGLWVDLWLAVDVVNADAVVVKRNGHLLLIEFEGNYPVHLGPVWQSTYQRKKERIVPLHIDILEQGGIRYSISGPYVHELKKA